MLCVLCLMILIVGLGNPGPKYKSTRHNIGFMTIDNLQLTIDNFSNWKLDKKSNSLIASGQMSMVNGQKLKVILAKPQTFMNLSGKSVKSLVNFYKITRPGLVVIHDDIDIPLGKIRIVKNRGAAGHKGVESIIRELGIKDFWRVRIGICPKAGKPKNIEKFVLQKFNKKEEEILKKIIEKSIEAIELSLKSGIEKAMQGFNK